MKEYKMLKELPWLSKGIIFWINNSGHMEWKENGKVYR